MRRFPVGAERLQDGAVSFRVWAPAAATVDLLIQDDSDHTTEVIPMTRQADGYFEVVTPRASAGTLYRYRLPDGGAYPDPASRFQPAGPHGPSMVIDATGFEWSDSAWRGPTGTRHIIYEIHVGTFTAEGTFAAAQEKLPQLADLGVDVIELMPLADFPGRFGWGYDGVDLFAPMRLYGMPADLRRFVQAAHALGIAVIVDVVYNHLGPDGCYLQAFAESYFSSKHETDWGRAINFDGPDAAAVREFFVANAGMWIEEFHFDGVRLDATQNIYDDSAVNIIAEIRQEVAKRAGGRRTFVVAENESQNRTMLLPLSDGGYGVDAIWNDDFHHSAMVAATGRREAYYSDYRGKAQELISAVRWGFLYQGQYYSWQQHRRGSPVLDLAHSCFVNYLQNHDQVANSLRGERLHQITGAARNRALTALLLLAPQSVMLFQGQEFDASAPFLYFADHDAELAEKVARGRREFLKQFDSIAEAQRDFVLAPPHDPATFAACKLDWSERESNREALDFHRDLIALSRDGSLDVSRGSRLEGAVITPDCLALRWIHEDPARDRLLLVNYGTQLDYSPVPEPLLAPPLNTVWTAMWSSEDPQYGGNGVPKLETPDGWTIPADCAVLFAPRSQDVT